MKRAQFGHVAEIVDLDGSSLKAIDKGAERYGDGNPVYVRFGEFVGTTKEDGTDPEQRAAREKYMKTYIRESPVQAATEIWRDINNRWGAATDQVGRASGENLTLGTDDRRTFPEVRLPSGELTPMTQG